MSDRSITVVEWSIPGSEQLAVVTVSYPTVAGLRRAYILDVQPVAYRYHADGGRTKSYAPTEGYRVILEDAPRYRAKQLQRWADDPFVLETALSMLDRICRDRGVSLPIEPAPEA